MVKFLVTLCLVLSMQGVCYGGAFWHLKIYANSAPIFTDDVYECRIGTMTLSPVVELDDRREYLPERVVKIMKLRRIGKSEEVLFYLGEPVEYLKFYTEPLIGEGEFRIEREWRKGYEGN